MSTVEANRPVPADLLSEAAARGITIQPHPYDIGYFERYLGRAYPSRVDGLAGWQACGDDLEDGSIEPAPEQPS